MPELFEELSKKIIDHKVEGKSFKIITKKLHVPELTILTKAARFMGL